METTEQKNSIFNANKDPRNQDKNINRNTLMNEEMYDIDKMKDTPQTDKEAADLGYTVRNGYDPNKPNPEQDQVTDEDEDDLNDDFHTDRDLEHDEIDEDDLEEENDELDNPTDVLTVEDDFNETEDDLQDIDQDDDIEEDDEDNNYKEEDINEEEFEENYPANDPRKF